MPDAASSIALQAVSAAGPFREGELDLGRDLAAVERIADDQRGFTRIDAQQPGHLLDHQQLVDGRILMVDAGGQHGRQLFQNGHQPVLAVEIFLDERRAPRCLRLCDLGPEFSLLRQQRLVQPIEIGDHRLTPGQVDRRQDLDCARQRRHQLAADAADVFLDVLVHLEVRHQLTATGRAVGADVRHRLEHIGGGRRHRDDPVGLLKPAP